MIILGIVLMWISAVFGICCGHWITRGERTDAWRTGTECVITLVIGTVIIILNS